MIIIDNFSKIQVKLSDESTVYVEVKDNQKEKDVGIMEIFNFENVLKPVKCLSEKFSDVLESAKPDKANIEFGIDFVVESGKLSACLVNNQTGASVKLNLEWNKKSE